MEASCAPKAHTDSSMIFFYGCWGANKREFIICAKQSKVGISNYKDCKQSHSDVEM